MCALESRPFSWCKSARFKKLAGGGVRVFDTSARCVLVLLLVLLFRVGHAQNAQPVELHVVDVVLTNPPAAEPTVEEGVGSGDFLAAQYSTQESTLQAQAVLTRLEELLAENKALKGQLASLGNPEIRTTGKPT